MSWRDLRELLLGETWEIPLGVAAIVSAALLLEAAAGSWWGDAGGFVVLALTLAVLAWAVARSGR